MDALVLFCALFTVLSLEFTETVSSVTSSFSSYFVPFGIPYLMPPNKTLPFITFSTSVTVSNYCVFD